MKTVVQMFKFCRQKKVGVVLETPEAKHKLVLITSIAYSGAFRFSAATKWRVKDDAEFLRSLLTIAESNPSAATFNPLIELERFYESIWETNQEKVSARKDLMVQGLRCDHSVSLGGDDYSDSMDRISLDGMTIGEAIERRKRAIGVAVINGRKRKKVHI